MTGMTALQVAPVAKVEPGETGNVFGMAGIGVTIDGDDYVISITDPTGLSLSARLDEANLGSFAHRLAFAIEEKNAAEAPAIAQFYDKHGERMVRRIIASVATATGFGVAEIEGPGREPNVVRVRKAAIWTARVLSTCSYPELGKIFGDRDHTTIIDQFRKAQALRDANPLFRKLTDDLKAAIETGTKGGAA